MYWERWYLVAVSVAVVVNAPMYLLAPYIRSVWAAFARPPLALRKTHPCGLSLGPEPTGFWFCLLTDSFWPKLLGPLTHFACAAHLFHIYRRWFWCFRRAWPSEPIESSPRLLATLFSCVYKPIASTYLRGPDSHSLTKNSPAVRSTLSISGLSSLSPVLFNFDRKLMQHTYDILRIMASHRETDIIHQH